MKKLLLPALLIGAFATLAGCSTPSLITLNDGRKIRVDVEYSSGGMSAHGLGNRRNSGGVIPRRAAGGTVIGPGSDIQDMVPALLSPGEGVLRADTVNALGGPGIIDALNNHQGTRASGTPIDYDKLAGVLRGADAGAVTTDELPVSTGR